MRLSPRLNRVVLALAMAALVLGASGCRMFGKKSELYTQSAESRPLEVPPDLDRPSADRAMSLPAAGGSVSASGMNNAGGSTAALKAQNAALTAKLAQLDARMTSLEVAQHAIPTARYQVAERGE